MMLARLCAFTMLMTAVALVAPGSVAPTDEAAAYCMLQIEGVDDCFNPCFEAGGVYGAARQATGAEDKTPDAHCPA